PGVRIGVPGTLTSAFLLLKLLLGNFRFEVLPFDGIAKAVLRGDVEAGLLIHEGQLTYQKFGLHPVVDLGKWWQADTGLPVPLGVNAVRRDLEQGLIRHVEALVRRSIEYALAHRTEAMAHAMRYARGTDGAVIDQFVSLYVNNRTVEMGEQGRAAVAHLLARGYTAGVLPRAFAPEFVT
ncbi:MAG: ABC transporter substrate-binding protein, partial [Verrucomicrobiae bacterium]|nr:ABC transporter substrate-binding protein [Verrucomicrobiae bacterium]